MAKKKAEQTVRKNLILRLYSVGLIDDKDLNDRNQYFEKLTTLDANEDLMDQINSMFVVDYREDLLKQAHKLRKSKQYEQAEMLYATFFEHELNSIVEILCMRKRLSSQATTNIFRKLSLEDKSSWLLELLSAPKLNDKYRKTIVDLACRRNGFVHYKYKLSRETRRSVVDDINAINTAFGKIERAVKYIFKYELIVCFKNKHKDLDRITKYLYT